MGSGTSRVLVCYDGSVPAAAAIEVAATLLPDAFAVVTVAWTPPYASDPVRHRLRRDTDSIDDFVAAIEREGAAEAHRLAAMGVTVAAAHGWKAEPLVERAFGGEGLHLVQAAERVGADLIVTGARGLGGARAVFGSVSDVIVHYASCPVLVVPHPLLQPERSALPDGPVVVGWDGSVGSDAALEVAGKLFPHHHVVPVLVDDGDAPSGRTPERLTRLPRTGFVAEHGRAIAAALSGQARAERAALLTVGSLGRSALLEIVLGSVTMAVLHHAGRPVLVVPHRGTGR
ncbi:universal stress protein [Actinoplanes italicus]|uniref:Nucleotide-binding universal stress UspA family protein n=1 Tax=Actinoplanes italicus TaxID=113567 RepID=A0A2T0KER6_9ACTN|nr:universal stress protein [Actinoplanes italicus]PRX21876.1 nucleotide-binding universal stress UspA family protein [Actinoplanes italicus]GIE29706.1 universal stress protein [Actinoplanes italicus]